MKLINKLWGMGLMALLLLLANPSKIHAQPGVRISFQTFYDELQPYGTWIDDPDYGDVWIPYAEENFRPYATRGHWIITEYGNTWVSDYEWGWAPFHYGRWRFDDYYGWEWIPGSEWGPAWVNWRSGDDYYAWAPLGPRISIDISFGGGYYVPDYYWVCAPRAYINSPRIYDYYVPRSRVANIINRTTIINNTYVSNNRTFIAGPRPQEIERYTHNRVQVYGINNVSRPQTTVVQNNTVNFYRPSVIRNNNGGERPRPATVVDATAYRNAHPNENIGNRAAGARMNRDNAAKLAQTVRDPQAENTGIVRVNRPAPNTGNNAPANNNNGRFNRGNQPNPAATPPSNANPNYNNGRYNRNRNQPNPAPSATPPANQTQPNPAVTPNNNAPATPNNDRRFNPNRSRPNTTDQNTDQQRQQRQQQDQMNQQRQQQQQQKAQQDQMYQQRQQQEQQRQQQRQEQQQKAQQDQMNQQRQQQEQQRQQQRQEQQQRQQQRQEQQQRPQRQQEQQRQQPEVQQARPQPQQRPAREERREEKRDR